MIIKITESDIKKIVQKILNEQSVVGAPGYGVATPLMTKSKVQTPPLPKKENINPKNLKLGDGGNKNPRQVEDVKKLQQKLIDLKLLSIPVPTGYLGSLTQSALEKYNDVTKVSTTQKERRELLNSPKVKNIARCETGSEKVLMPNAELLFDGDFLYWITDNNISKKWGATSGVSIGNSPLTLDDYSKLLGRYTKNREVWSKEVLAGPLPEGDYSVGPLKTRQGDYREIGALEAFFYKITGQLTGIESDRDFCKNTLVSRISWGNYIAPIKPTGSQNMYGRGSFYIHGGSIAGSHGCIDLTNDMEGFSKYLGIWTSSTGKKTIKLRVKYKNPIMNQVIQKILSVFS